MQLHALHCPPHTMQHWPLERHIVKSPHPNVWSVTPLRKKSGWPPENTVHADWLCTHPRKHSTR